MWWIFRSLDRNLHLIDNANEEFGLRDCIPAALGLKRAARQRGIVTLHMSAPFSLRGQTADLYTFEEVFFRKAYFHKRVRNISTVIDAGAHIGCTSVFLARRFPSARILAIEPDKANFELLCRNTAPYQNIKTVRAALWGRECTVKIADPDADSNAYWVEESEGGLAAITIPQALALMGMETVDLLKVDIEGSERSIFGGDCDWLSRVKILMIELHDRAFPGCTKLLYRALEPYEYVQHARGSVTIIRLNHCRFERFA